MNTLTKKEYIVIVFLLVLGFILYRFTLNLALAPEEIVVPEEKCEDLVVKTTGEDYMLSQPERGTYIYKLYVTPDGWTEVYKCK